MTLVCERHLTSRRCTSMRPSGDPYDVFLDLPPLCPRSRTMDSLATRYALSDCHTREGTLQPSYRIHLGLFERASSWPHRYCEGSFATRKNSSSGTRCFAHLSGRRNSLIREFWKHVGLRDYASVRWHDRRLSASYRLSVRPRTDILQRI